jgi:hypothetical protein
MPIAEEIGVAKPVAALILAVFLETWIVGIGAF